MFPPLPLLPWLPPLLPWPFLLLLSLLPWPFLLLAAAADAAAADEETADDLLEAAVEVDAAAAALELNGFEAALAEVPLATTLNCEALDEIRRTSEQR